MGAITLDEYYLTEQDETTVWSRTGGRPDSLEAGARTLEGSPDGARRAPRPGLRRRLHVLRRAAALVLAA